MSTPIKSSNFTLLLFAICFVLLSNFGVEATAQDIQWRTDLEQAKAEAAKTNRLVWLHFSADWCVPCKKLETFVFKDSGVIRTADRNVVAVKIDADENDSLVRKLGVPKIPYDIVMTPGGETIIKRPSPQYSSDYLRIFNGLDKPLQVLNAGDRESINAGINQLHKVIGNADGLQQTKSDLDLDGPSHQMAASTVEGQRLARGLSSVDRAAEIRGVQAKLLRQKAELFIAEEEERLQGSQGPKFSENPFFKNAGGSSPSINQGKTKIISNQFLLTKDEKVEQDKAGQLEDAGKTSDFLPPSQPVLAAENAKKVGDETVQVADSKEFSLPKLNVAENKVAENKVALMFEKQKQLIPDMPKFLDRSSEKVEGNEFAYAPISDLKKSLQSKINGSGGEKEPAVEKGLSQAGENPLRNTLAAVEERSKPVKDPRKTAAVVVPRSPIMVEGVVTIGETMLPTVEGRLVAAEQPIEKKVAASKKGTATPRATVDRAPVMAADPMLEEVNFFASARPVQPPAQVTIVQAQPTPPPQVVINLNAGSSPRSQANQPRNVGRIVQAGVEAPVANRARIKTADIASAVRSKYALKGKCPVTLLTQGQWVDGEKEIGCVHRDRVYLFASVAARNAFQATPDQLSPLLAGFDPVIFEETGKLIEGEEAFGTFMGEAPSQRIVLFKTADTRARFQKEPVKYLNYVRSAMTKSAEKATKLR